MEVFTPLKVKEKRPPGREPKHSAAYRMMVAKKVVVDKMSYRDASKTFGLSHGSIYNLVKNYDKRKRQDKKNAARSKYTEKVETYRHESHLKDLKLQIADLYLENLMLKKMLEHSLLAQKESSSDITSENLDLLREPAK